MNKRKIGVLVSGRGSNLQAIIDKIAAESLPIEICLVISDSPEAFALERAAKAGITGKTILRQEFKDKASYEAALDAALRNAGVELVVLAGFMRILSGEFVTKWPHAIINIHPALLPSFKGLDAGPPVWSQDCWLYRSFCRCRHGFRSNYSPEGGSRLR